MSTHSTEPRTGADEPRDDLADGRNGRVVGENDDNLLESIGKAIVAPVEGADEQAENDTAAEDRPFTGLTRTLPQADPDTRSPTGSRPADKTS